MKLENIRLYYDTIKFLKLSQVYWRLKYKIFKSKPQKVFNISHEKWLERWCSPLWSADLWDGGSSFKFLGEEAEVKTDHDWGVNHKSTLWVYNLHYLDCINVIGQHTLCQEKKLIISWIHGNRDVDRVGWDAYCLSLRIVNLVKWCSRNDCYTDVISLSIARQAASLMSKLEYHILGKQMIT